MGCTPLGHEHDTIPTVPPLTVGPTSHHGDGMANQYHYDSRRARAVTLHMCSQPRCTQQPPSRHSTSNKRSIRVEKQRPTTAPHRTQERKRKRSNPNHVLPSVVPFQQKTPRQDVTHLTPVFNHKKKRKEPSDGGTRLALKKNVCRHSLPPFRNAWLVFSEVTAVVRECEAR